MFLQCFTGSKPGTAPQQRPSQQALSNNAAAIDLTQNRFQPYREIPGITPVVTATRLNSYLFYQPFALLAISQKSHYPHHTEWHTPRQPHHTQRHTGLNLSRPGFGNKLYDVF